MNITVSEASADVAIMTLSGRLNATSADQIGAAVRSATDTGRPRIVLDLAAVVFMDSSGLGAVVRALKTARGAGGDLRVARPSPQARLVFELTNMDRVLDFFDDPLTAFEGG